MSAITRCQPHLGCYVFVRVSATSDSAASLACDAAFAAIAQVERLMSYYIPDSDVSKLNSGSVVGRDKLHSWTRVLLSIADELNIASNGRFNIYNPESKIDLGGIAKGFAVDMAIAAIKHAGCTIGSVNAGGDIASFGEATPIQIRCSTGEILTLGDFEDGAIATSDPLKTWQGSEANHRVTVLAPTATLADGLTKVCDLQECAVYSSVDPLLRRHAASAIITSGNRVVGYYGKYTESREMAV